MDFRWNDQADAILKGMWGVASHDTIAAAISAECGVTISHSAIGGRAHRLGLPVLRKAKGPRHKEPKPKRHAPVNFNAMRSGPSLKPLPLPKEQVTDAPPEMRVKLIDLKPDGRRFHLGDVGEPGAGFCPETGYPYCPEHARRCAQPRFPR
jgi:hypothetical protein